MIHIFDGAAGTMLQAAGLQPGECPELVNIERPEMMAKIHRAYIDAGSTIIETNTFGASPLKLEHYGLAARASEINAAGVKVAKSAGNVKVAGSIGPSGRFIKPLGDLDFDEAYSAFFTQAKALADAGADFIILETFIDIQEMRAALLAVKEAAPRVPAICQMSYSEDGRTVSGTDPETAAVTFDAMGADIIGVNCSLGPAELLPVVEIIARSTDKPVSVQPNAGLPELVDGKTIYPMTPDDFALWAPKLVKAGASYIGGCCGTTPAHIKAMADSIRGIDVKERAPRPKILRLTSRIRTVSIDSTLPTALIGERINPTGRKKLAAEIKEGSFLSVKKEAIEQTKAGASVLDVNMGVAGIDQTAAMGRAIMEIAQITAAPLSIDTGDAAALEAGLRNYPGRALVNSVSAEPDRLRDFLPLAKKYGAAILCLPVTPEGVPKTAAERVEIIAKIIKAAKEAGLSDGDFLLDGLVLTVAAEERAASETLDTLRLYRERFGYPSTMGLSNISFGLPARPLINSTFFSMCLAAGLDAPIMNPYDDAMRNALAASSALLGRDPNGRAFSRAYADQAKSKTAVFKTQEITDTLEAIKIAVMDGEKERLGELVERAVEEGHGAKEIMDRALTAAMNDVGADFGAGRVFLPQVLLSAEAMRAAFTKLSSLFPADAAEKIGTVVIATVKGDVHDLGKNIVAALLANSGFTIIDLGKDVPASQIVESAVKNHADIVGLCALMTTTMPEIKNVVRELRKSGSKVKIIAGGAAVTQEYVEEAGADAYAPDGVAAVKIAKGFMDNEK